MLYWKGDILKHVRPDEAIVILKKVLELEERNKKERDLARARLKEAAAAYESGDPFAAARIIEEVESQYGDVDARPSPFGDGPYRVHTVRISLAESLEAAKRWKEAEEEYHAMLDSFAVPDLRYVNDDVITDLHSIKKGIYRCFYQANHFEAALFTGQEVLNMDRTWPGVHKLVAEAQLGQARKLGYKTRSNVAGTHTRLSPPIADAILTMRRALVYEAPWDETNNHVNENYLEQLIKEAAKVEVSSGSRSRNRSRK
jgi:tetratricopeptide (TPR) repeat protein